jgi:two-component system OmpR family response regulator
MTEEKKLPPLKTIILVEDEPDIQILIKIALETVGKFNVQIFSSGKELIKQIDSLSADLILLDVMMPDMDGMTVLLNLRKNPHSTKIPVIFITASVSNKDIAKYKKTGALDVIAKPFDPMTLADRVANMEGKLWLMSQT